MFDDVWESTRKRKREGKTKQRAESAWERAQFIWHGHVDAVVRLVCAFTPRWRSSSIAVWLSCSATASHKLLPVTWFQCQGRVHEICPIWVHFYVLLTRHVQNKPIKSKQQRCFKVPIDLCFAVFFRCLTHRLLKLVGIVFGQVLVFFGSSAWRFSLSLVWLVICYDSLSAQRVLHTDQRGNWYSYFCFDCGPWGGYGRTCHNILLEHPRDVLNIKRWDKVHLEVFSGRTFARVLERGVVSIMKFVGCSVRLKKMLSKWRKEKCIWIVVLAMHVALEAHILQMWGRDAKRNVSLKVTTVYNSRI